jgi:hypothetical protein
MFIKGHCNHISTVPKNQIGKFCVARDIRSMKWAEDPYWNDIDV